MGGYLVHFSVFTFAMIGIMFLAVMIYSKTNINAKNSKKGGMKIEESLNLTPRKTLHVVNVNGEKFLIAADAERTEFLAKLDNETTILGNGDLIKGLRTNPNVEISKSYNVYEFPKRETLVGDNTTKNSTNNFKSSRLSQVKSIDMKKPAFMKSVMQKLEA